MRTNYFVELVTYIIKVTFEVVVRTKNINNNIIKEVEKMIDKLEADCLAL